MHDALARIEELEDFPPYAICEEGHVHNLKTGRELRASYNQQGIATVTLLGRDRRPATRSVAVLVATQFVPGKTEIFNTPIHLNGDRRDCDAANLMWRPRWFAREYHRQFNFDEFHYAQPSIMLAGTTEVYDTLKEPCVKYGLLASDLKQSFMTGHETLFTGQVFETVR